MGGSSSKGPSRADPLPPHGMRCLGVTLEVNSLLNHFFTEPSGALLLPPGPFLPPRDRLLREQTGMSAYVRTG